jgi:hypothetical protein
VQIRFPTETRLSNFRDGSSKAKILQESEPSIKYDVVDKENQAVSVGSESDFTRGCCHFFLNLIKIFRLAV